MLSGVSGERERSFVRCRKEAAAAVRHRRHFLSVRKRFITHVRTSDVLEEPEAVGVLVPEELAHDHVGEAPDEPDVSSVAGVVEPVVPRRRVVALELAGRSVAEDDHLRRGKEMFTASGTLSTCV